MYILFIMYCIYAHFTRVSTLSFFLWSLPQGRVGINVDLPPEALSVSGNIHLTGQLLQPSDERIKHSIAQVSSGCVGGTGGQCRWVGQVGGVNEWVGR